MKTKPKPVKEAPRRRLTKGLTKGAHHAQIPLESTLPRWVIGAYDGPSDGTLSLQEGYATLK